MRRVSRRQFTRMMGGAAVAMPIAAAFLPGVGATPANVATGFNPPSAAQQPDQPKPESKLKLTKEQEERVKQAVERRERQIAAIRTHPLGYDAEPAFVFQVRRTATGRAK